MDNNKAIQNNNNLFNEDNHSEEKAINEYSDSDDFECVSHSELNDTQSYDYESILSSTSSDKILHQLLASILAKLSAVEESVKELQNERKMSNKLLDKYVVNSTKKLSIDDSSMKTMDENIVAVHIIESVDGTHVTTEMLELENEEEAEAEAVDDTNDAELIEDSCNNITVTHEIIRANDHINELQDQHIKDDGEEIKEQLEESKLLEESSMNEQIEETTDQNNEELAEADDIIIAEAVVITQYSCKFCNRRFDTIDKVKNHYLLRHNSQEFSIL